MHIKRLLKYFDFYGTQFHWFIGFKKKHYSSYGGIFTILSLIMWILFLIILGMDDFKRTHPIISESTIPPSGYKIIKFGEKKLYIPWRIVDYDEKPLNIKGILYPKIFYFSSKYNEITGKMDTNYTLINYTLCNETSMKNLGKEFLLDINIEHLYCIDMEQLDMGGSFNADFINYIRLDLYLCENGIKYDEKNNKCTPYDKFDELHGKDNAWFFEVLYPKVQFQPTVPGIPVLILYQTYYYIFSKYSNKLDRIYLQEHVIEDEKGWIFNIVHNVSYWGTYSIGGENYYRGENDILKYGSNSRLYSLKIYLNLGITYYTRKYKKLYEILSEIFLIVKAISAIFTYLCEEMNDIYSSKKINELIIDKEFKYRNINNLIKPKNDSKNELKTHTVINHKFNRNSVISDVRLEKNMVLKKRKSKKKPNGIDDSANLDLNNNVLSNSVISHRIQYNYNNYRNSFRSNHKPENHKFPLIYYIISNFLMRLKYKKNMSNCLPTNFKNSFLIFRHLIDISSYITLFKQFEIIKKILINQNLLPGEHNFEKKEEITIIKKNKGK